MSTNLTEVSTFTTPVTVPSDGDARNAASVNTAFQALANRTKFLNGGIPNGLLVGREWSTAGGAASIIFGQVSVLVGGVWLTYTGGTVGAAGNVEGGGALLASTRYYIYAYNASGSLGIQLSTTAPDSGLTWKTGTTTHRYLGTIFSNGSAQFDAVQVSAGRYRYPTRQQILVLVAGTGAFVTQSLAGGGLPPHARLATICIENFSTAADVVEVQTPGFAGNTHRVVACTAGGGAACTGVGVIPVVTDASLQIQWKAPATSSIILSVLEWSES